MYEIIGFISFFVIMFVIIKNKILIHNNNTSPENSAAINTFNFILVVGFSFILAFIWPLPLTVAIIYYIFLYMEKRVAAVDARISAEIDELHK